MGLPLITLKVNRGGSMPSRREAEACFARWKATREPRPMTWKGTCVKGGPLSSSNLASWPQPVRLEDVTRGVPVTEHRVPPIVAEARLGTVEGHAWCPVDGLEKKGRPKVALRSHGLLADAHPVR